MPRTELLPVPLADAEIRDRATAMADLVVAIEKAEDRMRDARAIAKSAIDEQRATLRSLAGEIAERQAQREVEVEDRPDFEEGEVYTVRLDTGEIVRSRRMTAEDRQLALGNRATVLELRKTWEGAPPSPPLAPPSADVARQTSERARARAAEMGEDDDE